MDFAVKVYYPGLQSTLREGTYLVYLHCVIGCTSFSVALNASSIQI